MKETEGELREGRVLHVHQSHYAFLHNRGLLQTGGVFVTRAMSLVSVVPRLRSHQVLPVGRWHKKPTSAPIPLTPDFYTGGASPAGTPSTGEYYSNTPAASPYAGATPAWNPSSRTPAGSPRAGGETLAPLPHSRSDHSALRGGETPIWGSTELPGDEGPMLEMDFTDDSSDVCGKLSSFLISTS
jgi:transcription elongation factor